MQISTGAKNLQQAADAVSERRDLILTLLGLIEKWK